MRYLPVNWSEGMFLRPQHFQAAERYWAEHVATTERWDHAYNYGIQAVEISDEAIANHQIELVRCHIRLRDGTLVALAPGQEPDRVDLKASLEGEGQVLVHLGIPKLVLGRTNVREPNATGEDTRYVRRRQAVQDDVLGGRDQDVEFRELDVRVLLSTEDLSGFETVPIARVKRSGEAESRPQLDEEYIPPLLTVDAWPPLSQDIIRAIYDLISEKIDILSQRVVDRGITLTSQEPGDLDDLFMLMLCNGAYGSLRCLAFAAGVHPFTAYTELCRIVSQLSIFHETCRPPEIPLYDHDDLGRIFRWIKQQIQSLLHRGDRLSYEQRFFVGTERGMQVAIEPKWLHAGWSWYVGVNSDSFTDRECRDLLKPGQLDWKIGSSQQVDLIFKRGLPGVLLSELPEAPRALPARQGWIFYEVQRDKENPAWKDVLATQTLAMRLTERLIINFESLQGQRSLEVAADGRRTVLQFALFAVPSEAQ